MTIRVSPSAIRGVIQVPASKSSLQRALGAAVIRSGKTILRNPGHAADDLAALSCIRALGASVRCDADCWTIESQGIHPTDPMLNCGESGLSMRMFTAIAALSDQPLRISGSGSLLNRPMHFFEKTFPALGVKIKSNQGCLPLDIQGPLRPSSIQVDGSLSSQFLTGLLMAYAAAGAEGVEIEVLNLRSRPYIDLTLDVLKKFGLPVPENSGYQFFSFRNKSIAGTGNTIDYTVEGDWSGAAFWFAAAAICGQVELIGLDTLTAQADRAILEVARAVGLEVINTPNSIQLKMGFSRAFEFDATDCPDLFPPLVVMAMYLPGVSVIHGAERLRHKESDRAQALKMEFEKLGGSVEISENSLRIKGGHGLRGGTVGSHGDHRIAMALAVAALGSSGPVTIQGAAAVEKSYPDFWRDLQSVGASLSLSE